MVFRVLFLVMFPCFRSEVIQNLLDQSDGPRMAQDGPGSSQWWWTLLWGTREQRRRLLQSLMDNVTLVGVLLSAIRITDPYGSIRSPVVVVALKKTWIHEFQGESRTWRCCCWCSLVFYTQFGFVSRISQRVLGFLGTVGQFHRQWEWQRLRVGGDGEDHVGGPTRRKGRGWVFVPSCLWTAGKLIFFHKVMKPVGPKGLLPTLKESHHPCMGYWKTLPPKGEILLIQSPDEGVSARRCSWLGRFCECHLAEGFGVHGWIVTFWYF